jgi:hypothetical protein
MPHMSADTAQTVALKSLAFLAENEDALERLFRVSGLDAGALRAHVDEAETLAAILDFLLGDEPLLIRFCESSGIDPKSVHLASHVLANAA